MTTASAEGFYTRKQRGTIVHIYLIHITIFISKFVLLNGVLSFQSKQICLPIHGPQCESLISHLQVRMNEPEMLCFQSKLTDAARE